MSDIIERLKIRIQSFPPVSCETNLTAAAPPCLSNADYERIEHESGLTLPPFVRRLYTEVANGGFGPAYGINALTGEDPPSISCWDRMYQNANHDEPNGPQWPTHLIRFCEIGCNMFYALDIREADTPVYEVEATESDDFSDWLTLKNSSVALWLDAWAAEPVSKSR